MKHLYLKDKSINPDLLERPIIIWGCGNDGRKLCQLLKEKKIEVLAFCDSNRNLYHSLIMDVPVISCEEALERNGVSLALAFHQWITIIGNIKVKQDTEIFADYLYEEAEQETKCIICESLECTGSRAHFSPFLTDRMFRGQDRQTKLIHCKNCNFWFSKYRPDDFEMEKLYSGYREGEYTKQRQKYEPTYSAKFYETDGYVEKRKAEINNFLQDEIDYGIIQTLLDYGGDKGQYIPKYFRNAEKYVFEISGSQVEEGVILLKNLEQVKKKKFDFVMCCQVLEHVSNPIEIIKNMVEVLKENGYLYIEVPNSNEFMAYSDIEIHEHINFFFKETMIAIGLKMNLKIKKIKMSSSCSALFEKGQS